MPTTTLTPDGTVTGDWPTFTGATRHESIDEGTGAPNGEYVETGSPGDVNEFTLSDTPADVATVDQVTVTINGYLDDTNSTARLQVNVTDSAGTDISGSPFYIDGSGSPGNFSSYGTTAETVSRTLTGLSLSKATADGLKVRTTLLAS